MDIVVVKIRQWQIVVVHKYSMNMCGTAGKERDDACPCAYIMDKIPDKRIARH